MVGVNPEGGYLRSKTIAPKIAATATTLGAGGSSGREGPIILIGGAIGCMIPLSAEQYDRIETAFAGEAAGTASARTRD